MQLINLLSQKLDADAKQAMAQATQATPAELEKGLNQITRLFIGVLVQPPLTSTRVESIQQVVDEGGHTGELLSNLPNLLADEQRSSLLIDIGTKIFNHFYEGDAEILTEKLTMVLGIRKPVIQSLLGLTPPLVLGTLGAQIRKERWTTQELHSYLEEQQADIQTELSPYLTPHLTTKASSSSPSGEPKLPSSSKKNSKKKSSFNFLIWLPWLLMGLLVAASWWYIRTLQSQDLEVAHPLGDSLSVLTDDANLAQIEERLNQRADSTMPSTPAPEPTPAPVPETQPEVVAKPKDSAPSPTPVPSQPRVEKTATSAPKEVPSSLSAALKTTFQSGSAEIKDDQVVKNLATKWLENKSGVLVIEGNLANRLTEDQAYALRERLFQLGVPTASIRIEKAKTPLQVTLK